MKACILDMQPIDPPVGGGRIRLLGLYGNLRNGIDAVYVGSYDWRGPSYREHRLTSCLTEVNVPLSEEHFAAHDALSEEVGMGCIDSAFPMQIHLSPELIARARKEAADAQVVVFSHPWLFEAVAPVLDRDRQLIVYDAHNCEGFLRSQIITGQSDAAERVRRCVVRSEWELCHAAHLVLACSREDQEQFERYYGLSPQRVAIVPNGVFSSAFLARDDASAREATRRKLGIDRLAACFIGSNYLPNEAAANLILGLAEKLPQHLFFIMGGVGERLADRETPQNVIVTGLVSEQEKQEILLACDLALNPMVSGSGTNIKMFDYMAAGLPIVTTSIGARGIINTGDRVYELSDGNIDSLMQKVEGLFADRWRYEELRRYGSLEAFGRYRWERLSIELGYLLSQKYREEVLKKRPYFSVVVPSYERHDGLGKLLEQLKRQTYTDFEMIIVDQSDRAYADLGKWADLDILYFHTDIRGAAKARNTGIRLSRGEVIAFIDDDCVPDPDWLASAQEYFRNRENVGLEGGVYADTYDDEHYRVVTNMNVRGMGFLTANLFIRADVLRMVDGFDEAFEDPFREDTDLGWRAREYGLIPFAGDVRVLHPSHPRDRGRESKEERNRFFAHDPLMLKKHGTRFMELFLSERHYQEAEYWDYFKQGMKRHHVDPALLRIIADDQRVSREYLPKDLFEQFDSVSSRLPGAEGDTPS